MLHDVFEMSQGTNTEAAKQVIGISGTLVGHNNESVQFSQS